jgi:hypothetical protein
VGTKHDHDPVRLKTLDLDGKPSVITLKLDLEFWPTYELRRNEGVWERVGRIDSSGAVSVNRVEMTRADDGHGWPGNGASAVGGRGPLEN